MSAEDSRFPDALRAESTESESREGGSEPSQQPRGPQYTVAHSWTLTGNTADADETIATIRDGPAVRVTGVVAKIESVSGANVFFHVRSGERQIAPEQGNFASGDDTFRAKARSVLSPDDTLTARWTNNSSTDRFAVVYVHLEVSD